MHPYFSKVCGGEVLTESEACEALLLLSSGQCAEAQVAGFATAYILRRPSVAELSGFRQALLQQCTPLRLEAPEALDIVGTGGDGKNSFNISTLSAIVAAAAGCTVVKHGSYGASSVSGSSNVLEQLGYRFLSCPEALQRQLDRTGICFLHAPLFHPAMQRVAPVRRSLGMRTFFNLLGPLVNPTQPARQVLGVNSLETARLYKYLLQQEGRDYLLLHSLDGYDEVSLTAPFKLLAPDSEQLLRPEDLGFRRLQAAELDAGKTVREAADLFTNVLRGAGTEAQQNVVIANSALAIRCARPGQSLDDCLAQAGEALRSGRALQTFHHLLN